MSNFSNEAFLLRMKNLAQNRPTMTPAPSRKRSRHERDATSSTVPSDDERDDNPGSTPIPGLNLAHPRSATQNAVNAVKSFAKKQKLRGEQLTQVDTFLNDTPTVREGKIFSLLLGLQNDVGNIIVAAPAFSVSAELQNILKKHRFDMPPGIENNPADMQKITAAVQYAFTQDRSSLKKKLFASVRVSQLNEAGVRVVVDLPSDQHQNLFALAQAFVDGTKCRITNALCGRIALMRDIYLQNSTSSFWSSLDAALSLMRTAADGNEEACDAMFEDLIIADKALHGAVDIVYQATNNIQQEVDDLIVAGRGREDPGAMDPPVDSTTEPEEDGAPGNGEEPQEQGPGQ
ncbi:hypothetical protein B0H14DRAFT_3588141 [Mycena olivaceomarginata]|nr:hypothetical protein B0H14DRAFT_3588141 [Mycena olivaceomarginata]